MPPTHPDSLFRRIGGTATLEAAVVVFYDKVRADPRIAPYFERLEMGTQVRKQIRFMTHVLGGPHLYSVPDLRSAHRQLVHDFGLSDEHFDALCQNLRSTLEELRIAPELIEESMAMVCSWRSDVLNR